MARVPTPLRWKRRSFAVLEQRGLVDQSTAVAVLGIVAGPFAIYAEGRAYNATGEPFVLIHLPSQGRILDLPMQASCKAAAERFAALDLNWWTCIPEEVIGPDLQEMTNLLLRIKPPSGLSRDTMKAWTGEEP